MGEKHKCEAPEEVKETKVPAFRNEFLAMPFELQQQLTPFPITKMDVDRWKEEDELASHESSRSKASQLSSQTSDPYSRPIHIYSDP